MMKKILLTTTLTAFSVSAFAQDYNPYNYEQEPSVYGQRAVEEEKVPYNYDYSGPELGVGQSSEYSRDWDLSLMAGLQYAPKYKGAASYEVNFVPGIKAEYRLTPQNRLFLSLEDGAGYGYSLTENLEIGGGLNYRRGRDSSDASILASMEDVDDTLTLMAYANYTYDDFNFGIKFDKGLDSSNDGLTTELSAGHTARLNDKAVIRTTLATVYGNNTYMKQNFGVSAADATPNRLAYNAESGFSEVSLSVFGMYNIEGPHNVLGSVKYTRLVGDAKDSSIVKSDDGAMLLVGYAYEF